MGKTSKKEPQLKLNIKYKKKSFIEKVSSSIESFKQEMSFHPYWKSGFSWLSLLSSIILGLNSFLTIFFNFDNLPSRIAMLFAEKLEEDIVKDKFLLYLLPIVTVILGVTVSFFSEKIFSTYPKLVKFISILIFILSLAQLLSVYKILSIYS